MSEQPARDYLIDYQIMRWLQEQPGQQATPDAWPGGGGLTESVVSTRLRALAAQRLLHQEDQLSGACFQLIGAGSVRLNELTQPSSLKRARSAFLRDTWVQLLYGNDNLSLPTRHTRQHSAEDPAFALAEPTDADHIIALDYLRERGLIDARDTGQEPMIFVWLTARGIECAESGESVTQFLERSKMSGFTQHNTFTNVGAAAAGRDGVSASTHITTGSSPLDELRSLLNQLDAEEQEEGRLIAKDLEGASQSQDDSLFKQRLRQLGRFIGGLANTALKAALESWLKQQMSGGAV